MTIFSMLPAYLYGAGSLSIPADISKRQMIVDLLSGLTVALALVPEAVSYTHLRAHET